MPTSFSCYDKVEGRDQPEDFPVGAAQALAHLGGYIAYSVKKRQGCSACVQLLADQQDGPADEVRVSSDDTAGPSGGLRGFTELLNRGRLMHPSPTCILLVKEICLLYRSVAEDDNRAILFGASNPKGVFQGVVTSQMKENQDFCHIVCEHGHLMVQRVLDTVAGSLFNAFTSNYVKEVNSEIHSTKSQRCGRPKTRDQSSHKIMELTGGKRL